MTADILVAILSFILLDYYDLDMKFWTSIVIQFTWKIKCWFLRNSICDLISSKLLVFEIYKRMSQWTEHCSSNTEIDSFKTISKKLLPDNYGDKSYKWQECNHFIA